MQSCSHSALVIVILHVAGCGPGTGSPAPAIAPPDGSAIRVLFLGNSLTAGHDVPAIVQAMAAHGGVRLEFTAITPGGTSLEDHWNAGAARKVLAGSRWDYLVLQQGPSSQPDSRENLIEWSRKWGDEARKHGTQPAMYMVWPVKNQREGFARVARSYRDGASAGGALILPAGEAWEAALRRDATVELYSGDGLHAELGGSYLAALVITYGLTRLAPETIPSSLTLASGQRLSIPSAQAGTLRAAAGEISAKNRRATRP